MQLKKKFALKQHLVAGAVTFAMLASSLPAFASVGNSQSIASQISGDLKTSFTNQKKWDRQRSRKNTKALAISSDAGALHGYQTEAKHAYHQAVKSAQAERNAAQKKATANYESALKAGIDVKVAQKDLAAAKKKLMQQYRDELAAAHVAYKDALS